MTNNQSEFNDTIRKQILNLKEQFNKLEKQYMYNLRYWHEEKEADLAELEYTMKSSIRWRIGSFVVVNAKRFIRLIKNPAKFFQNKNYRTIESIRPSKPKESPQLVPQASVKNLFSEMHHGFDEVLTMVSSSNDYPENKSKTFPWSEKKKAAAILDEFTDACLQPELDLISFRTDNWKETLEAAEPQLLFIESAWHGNMGSWQYRIAKYQKNMGDEVLDLLEWAKESRIPSVFWNKEDPPNFDRFIDKAKLFDFVFTSDENCIPAYKKHIEHNRIYSLPFAAQPRIHNPIVEKQRTFQVCFAGTYHSDEYYERRNDMEILLKPAMDFDFHIFDRNFGAVAPGSERFRFPDIYQPFIKGRLNYEDMLKAYRQYKVFLNVNSVKDSPTMFSRRVFELLACGTPVISTYSRGIDEMLGDAVFITENESDTKKHLEALLSNELVWMRASVKGIRLVLSGHTYEERIRYLLEKVGIDQKPKSRPQISIIAYAEKPEQLRKLASSIKTQVYKPVSVVILSEYKLASDEIETFKNEINNTSVFNFEFTQNPLHSVIADNCPSDYYAVFQFNDYYAPNYLNDYAFATVYSDQQCLGKSSYYTFIDSKISLSEKGKQFMLVNKIALGSLMFRKDFLLSFNFLKLRNTEAVFTAFTSEIISLDPLNYLKNPNGSDVPQNYIADITC